LEHYLDFCAKTGVADVVVDGCYYTCRNAQGCVVAVTCPRFSIPEVCIYLRPVYVAFVDVTKDKMRSVKHPVSGVETLIILRKGVAASTASVLLELIGLDEDLNNSSLASKVKARSMQVRVVADGDLKLHRRLREHESFTPVVAGSFHVSKNLGKAFLDGGHFCSLKCFKTALLKHLACCRELCYESG
jgi:hypothetical protein